MAECVRTPTRTTSVPFVTNSVFPTTFTSASSLPDTFVTTAFFTDICTFNATLEEEVCSEVRTTVVRTILGETTSVLVTEITTIPVTTLIPTTLFGTSCPPDVIPSPDPPTSIPDSSTTIFAPPTSDPSSRITSPGSSSRTSSGYTSRTSGSSSLPPTSSLPADGTETTNIAPIVGGAVGGVVGLLVLGVLAWFFFKKAAFGKNSNFDNIFNKTDGMDHIHPEKPIVNFGMQGGQQVMQNMAQNQAPANNNGTNNTQQNQGQPTGQQGQGQQGYQNGYQPQGQDGYQTGYQQGDPTGGIDQTLNNGVEYQPQGNEQDGPDLDDIKRKQLQRLFKAVEDEQGQAPHPQMPSNMPLARPLSNGGIPAVAPFVVNQVYPPQQPQFSNSPVNGYHPHHAQQGYYPQAAPSTLSHNPSVGGSSGYYGSQYGSPNQPVVGLPPSNQGHVLHHAPSTSSYGRTGSPVPVQNTQVLQVVNPEASYQYNHGHSASASGSSYAAGSSAAATPAYPTDGKGRPVNMGGEKAPIVHLDGGRYEEPAPSTSGTTHPPSDPPPPMYSS